MKLDGIEGRVAFVTGGGRGIGRRIAETLSRLGARVAAGDLQAPALGGVLGIAVDVTDEAQVDQAFTTIERELGHVSLLVLNAGIFAIESLETTSLDLWNRTLAVNLTGAFLCARRALPGMRQSGFGRIVAIGSSAGKTGGSKNMAAYAASKAGIMALAKSIAFEYAAAGITANALAPALIDTEMISAMPDLHARVPIGRLGTVQDVADVVAFLCSAHAGYITGEVMDVNGGFFID
jgi:NAD(P)-dependent dehydrogenase (short-subunit alcohol dehydrogenase family)